MAYDNDKYKNEAVMKNQKKIGLAEWDRRHSSGWKKAKVVFNA